MAEPQHRAGKRSGKTDPFSPFYIPATAAGLGQKSRVLKSHDSFAVLDDFGNAQANGPAAEGLFFEDTRYLSRLVMTVDGMRPLLLSSALTDEDGMLLVDLTNPDVVEDGRPLLARATVHILNRVFLSGDSLFATLELRNFGLAPTGLRIGLEFAADFVDIFEVRGSRRPARGAILPVEMRPEGPVHAYRGLDRVVRRTRFGFDPPPDHAAPGDATWDVRLAPGTSRTIALVIRCDRGEPGAAAGGAGAGEATPAAARTASLETINRESARRRAQTVAVETSNEAFNDWLNRSRADLDMLITETPQGPYAYAGIPWFSTAFGRDGLITAFECLWVDPTLAAGTLRFLAAHQATALDPKADAEPGKILHETRNGEMAALGEVPFGRYYGSVDATPLFVVLASAYYGRTGDLDLVRALWPAIEAALAWMSEYGDRDGDGLLEYDRQSPNGLVNQGWKDSNDSIFHEDGSLAEAPIALAEVQAYAHAALVGAAGLATALGKPERAAELDASAARLKARFEAAFWLDDLGTYALALDGTKAPCRVRSSNAGQVLLADLASPERAARTARTLMSPASFSGWGIRTIAEGEARYSPISYHDGSVWPHDNALIAIGFGRYGLKEPLVRLMSGLFEAANIIELKRLPELFCGFARRSGAGPTSYPVACSPQAWSAATAFAVLGATLGIGFSPQQGIIRFARPLLPKWLDEVRLANLCLGEGSVDLRLRRSGGDEDVVLDIVRRDGPVEVVVTR